MKKRPRHTSAYVCIRQHTVIPCIAESRSLCTGPKSSATTSAPPQQHQLKMHRFNKVPPTGNLHVGKCKGASSQHPASCNSLLSPPPAAPASPSSTPSASYQCRNWKTPPPITPLSRFSSHLHKCRFGKVGCWPFLWAWPTAQAVSLSRIMIIHEPIHQYLLPTTISSANRSAPSEE